ncbi:MAG: sulfatase, partial [Verrucomicrobiae bacterium]|nr:sulfatase [Verrucomicrobiae bacterium]
MNPIDEFQTQLKRRAFLGRSSRLLGGTALASLLGRDLAGAATGGGGIPTLPHHAPKAKRVIYLFMAGGPS